MDHTHHLAPVRETLEAVAAQIAELNRALGLRADGTPRRQGEAKTDGQANCS